MEKQAVTPSTTPATYIQADAATFKDLVQKLTGAPGGSAHKHKLRPRAAASRPPPFKLQERRKHCLRDLDISKLGVESTGNSPGKSRSSGLLPSPVKGPMTPLGCDSVLCERVGTESPPSEEERSIAEKGFYLHATPPNAPPPVLLTLFPLTSPTEQEF